MPPSFSHIIDNPPKKSIARSYELARKMIPVLIRWAQEKRSPQYYSTLSKAIGHKSPEIGFQLGVVADIFKELSKQSGEDVPILNALVISKASKMPSYGLGDVIDEYKDEDKDKRIRKARELNQKAYNYKRWPWVLEALGLLPYTGSPSEVSIRKGTFKSGASEGPYHKALKEYILEHHDEVSISDVIEKDNEHILLSGDRLDVFFKLKNGKQIAIEVKSRISDDADILRGIYQCVKYKAVLSAECLAHGQIANVDAFLITEKELSEENRKTANMLSVNYIVFDSLVN